jgi:hypothetical protein
MIPAETNAPELACALEGLGYELLRIGEWPRPSSRPTLAGYLRERRGVLFDAALLLLTAIPGLDGYHWVGAKGPWLGDSFMTDGEWRMGTPFPDWRLRSAFEVRCLRRFRPET